MGIRELFGKNVKYYRSCRGYSQEDLAGRCNDIKDKDALSGRAFISGIECGISLWIKSKSLQKLSALSRGACLR